MSVHPRSIYTALFEYERSHGGRQWTLSEIQLRMDRLAASPPQPAGLEEGEG